MLRQFLTILAATLIAVFGVTAGVDVLYGKIVHYAERPFLASSFSGVFSLLNERIRGVPESKLDDSVAVLRGQFKLPLRLAKASELHLESTALNTINDGEIYVGRVDGAPYLYGQSERRDRVWVLAADWNNHDKNTALTVGPFTLIKDQLVGKTSTVQQKVLSEIAAKFPFPVLMRSIADSDLSEPERSRLHAGLVVSRNPGVSGERYYSLVPGTNALIQIGPIPFPPMIGLLPVILIGLFVLLLCVANTLWLGPLWRDLRRLITTSDDIASGNLDARVSVVSRSMIRPVISRFNHMAERSQNMIASQQALTNAVSHELRTPLARLKFSLELARQPSESASQERHHAEINESLDELTLLVEELLTFTRYDQIESTLELDQLSTVCLNGWIAEQLKRASRGLAGKLAIRQESFVSDTEQVRFHSRLMSYAFSNGLRNAIRHAETTVKVIVNRRDDMYVLQIDDDGPGIPVELRESLFEPFRRADSSRNRSSGGFGLGLSIVDKVVDWHDGQAVICESSLGGTQLQISWPAKFCAAPGTTNGSALS